MNACERISRTLFYVRKVREHYCLLQRKGGKGQQMRRQERYRLLADWLEVIENANKDLRSRAGKSAAKAKHDWLISRVIEMMIYDGMGQREMQIQLTGFRPVTAGYVETLKKEALRVIQKKAEEAGLLR